jgi:uncharacterized membrane protein (DUF4010 family)
MGSSREKWETGLRIKCQHSVVTLSVLSGAWRRERCQLYGRSSVAESSPFSVQPFLRIWQTQVAKGDPTIFGVRMPDLDPSAIRLVVAIGIGLLIGAERERRKGGGPRRGPAGVRTFALAAFAGALSCYLRSEVLLVLVAGAAVIFSALAYRNAARRDPGLTTEFALIVSVLLGALTMQKPLLAAGLSVVTTILLAARERLHRVLRDLLSHREAEDALVFLAATLVILPLAPDRTLGPFNAFNPRKIWELVVLVMAIGATSHIALRAFGARLGLALAGFVGGFVSASATIGSMSNRANRNPELGGSATSGAVLATVATVVQLFLVLLVTSGPTCHALALPLLFAGIAAIGYALFFVTRSSQAPSTNEAISGRAFDLRLAFLFAGTISVILFLCAALNEHYGSRGVLVGAALSGFADTHATAISIASLVRAGRLAPETAVGPILLGFTTNTLTKAIVAFSVGGSRFGLKLLPGLVLVVAAAFVGMWVGGW